MHSSIRAIIFTAGLILISAASINMPGTHAEETAADSASLPADTGQCSIVIMDGIEYSPATELSTTLGLAIEKSLEPGGMVFRKQGESLAFFAGSQKMAINGAEKKMKYAAKAKDGIFYVPLDDAVCAAFSNLSGLSVTWNPGEKNLLVESGRHFPVNVFPTHCFWTNENQKNRCV